MVRKYISFSSKAESDKGQFSIFQRESILETMKNRLTLKLLQNNAINRTMSHESIFVYS